MHQIARVVVARPLVKFFFVLFKQNIINSIGWNEKYLGEPMRYVLNYYIYYGKIISRKKEEKAK